MAPRCATPHHVWTEGSRLCECGTFDREATLKAGALVRVQEQHATLVGTETDGAPILEMERPLPWCAYCGNEGHHADDCDDAPHDCADEPCAGCGRFFFHADDCPTPLERCPCVPDDTIGPRRRATESEPDEDRHGMSDAAHQEGDE